MAAIYDKALKRRDFSGIVDKNAKTTQTRKPDDEKADDPKAGADVGKIVNLMAGDANRVISRSLVDLMKASSLSYHRLR
jgi:hypothetical protein